MMTKKSILFTILSIGFTLNSPFNTCAQEWIHYGPNNGYITYIEIAAYDTTVVFAGTQRGGTYRCNQDDWQWHPLNETFTHDPNDEIDYGYIDQFRPSKNYWYGDYPTIRTIKTHPDSPNKVWVATNNRGIHLSVDGGETWEAVGDDIHYDFEESFIQLERSHYTDESLYLVARGEGVYHWMGPGHEWELLEGPYGWRVT